MSGQKVACCTCGYEWEKGQNGSHHCSNFLLIRIKDLEKALNDQLNDCINFDGSKLTDAIMQQSSRILKREYFIRKRK